MTASYDASLPCCLIMLLDLDQDMFEGRERLDRKRSPFKRGATSAAAPGDYHSCRIADGCAPRAFNVVALGQ